MFKSGLVLVIVFRGVNVPADPNLLYDLKMRFPGTMLHSGLLESPSVPVCGFVFIIVGGSYGQLMQIFWRLIMPNRNHKREEITSYRFPLHIGEVLEGWHMFSIIRTAPMRIFRMLIRHVPFRSVEEPDGHLVFVYGTLRRGQHNNYLLKDQKFVGEAISSCPHFTMMASGIPFVSYAKANGHRVRGEIFMVSDACLDRLDQLEGHPDWYQRDLRLFEVKGKVVTAWIYLCNHGKGQPVQPTGKPLALEAPHFR
jgi:gamma-glutamylaminecyclotransferase